MNGKQVTIYWRDVERRIVDKNGEEKTVTERYPYFNNMKYVGFPNRAKSIFKEMLPPGGVLYRHHRSIVIKNYKAEKWHKECYDKIMQRYSLPIRCPEPDINFISTGRALSDAGDFSFRTYLFGYYGFRLIHNRLGSDYWEEVYDMSPLGDDQKGSAVRGYYASEFSLSLMFRFIKDVRNGDAKGIEEWSPPQPKK